MAGGSGPTDFACFGHSLRDLASGAGDAHTLITEVDHDAIEGVLMKGHLLAAIDAHMAGAPVIAVTGGPTPQSRYRHAYQEVDDITQFDAVTKFNAQVDHVTRMPDLVRQAFRVATSGAPGPVHLRIQSHLG